MGMNKAFQFVAHGGLDGDGDPERVAKMADLQGRAAAAEGTTEQMSSEDIARAAHKAVEAQIAGIEQEARDAGVSVAEADRAKDKLAAKALAVMLEKQKEKGGDADAGVPGPGYEKRDLLTDPFGWLMDTLAELGAAELDKIQQSGAEDAEKQMLEYLQQNPEVAAEYLNNTNRGESVQEQNTQSPQGEAAGDRHQKTPGSSLTSDSPPPQSVSGGGDVLRGLVAKFQAQNGMQNFSMQNYGNGGGMPESGPPSVGSKPSPAKTVVCAGRS